MIIHEAAQNYLETILMEQKKRGKVRSIDICNALGYSRPTISVMMKNFRENGYITMDDSGFIELTEKGLEIAQSILERHNIITRFLESLGVSHETALLDACKMEHDLSDETMECIKQTLLNKQ